LERRGVGRLPVQFRRRRPGAHCPGPTRIHCGSDAARSTTGCRRLPSTGGRGRGTLPRPVWTMRAPAGFNAEVGGCCRPRVSSPEDLELPQRIGPTGWPAACRTSARSDRSRTRSAVWLPATPAVTGGQVGPGAVCPRTPGSGTPWRRRLPSSARPGSGCGGPPRVDLQPLRVGRPRWTIWWPTSPSTAERGRERWRSPPRRRVAVWPCESRGGARPCPDAGHGQQGGHDHGGERGEQPTRASGASVMAATNPSHGCRDRLALRRPGVGPGSWDRSHPQATKAVNSLDARMTALVNCFTSLRNRFPEPCPQTRSRPPESPLPGSRGPAATPAPPRPQASGARGHPQTGRVVRGGGRTRPPYLSTPPRTMSAKQQRIRRRLRPRATRTWSSGRNQHERLAVEGSATRLVGARPARAAARRAARTPAPRRRSARATRSTASTKAVTENVQSRTHRDGSHAWAARKPGVRCSAATAWSILTSSPTTSEDR